MNRLRQALERRAQLSPDDTVLEGVHSVLNASELLALVAELSLDLRAADVTTVALLADNSPQWALLDIACQVENICLVPVPTFFSPQQVKNVLQRAGVELLFHDPALTHKLETVDRAVLPCLDSLRGYTAVRLKPDIAALAPANTSKITFTSGSTGEPKGVCLSFEQCLAVATSLAESIGVERPRHLCVLPLSTLLENIGGVYMPLLAGGTCVILPGTALGMQGSSGIEAAAFIAALERHRPDTLILVPQLLTVLDEALAQGWNAPDSLQFVAVGGARVSPAVLERVRARGLPVYEGYGLSECASVVSLNRPGADRSGSGGRVLPHVEVFSRQGELLVSGNTFLGYLNEPDTWGAPLVFTGDLGTVDADGFVTVAGRKKSLLINSFGRNISPEWVESELLGGNVFLQAVVLGDGRPFCSALLYPRDATLADADIQLAIDQVNRRLPDYARIGGWLRLSQPLSAAGSLLTDNGRPRREQINARFSQSIEQLYFRDRGTIAL